MLSDSPDQGNMIYPNALAFDDHRNLYATDSLGGSVWRFNPDDVDETGALWVQHDLLAPSAQDPLGSPIGGANGIAFFPNTLYVANTEKGLIARIPIKSDGNPGPPPLVAGGSPIGRLIAVDGIATDANGNIHAVIPTYEAASLLVPPVLQPPGGYAPLVQVTPNAGEIMSTMLDNPVDPRFDVPLSLAFGTLGDDRTTVFITNGALPPAQGVPGPGPRIIQVGLGVPGFITVPEPSSCCLIAVVLLAMCLARGTIGLFERAWQTLSCTTRWDMLWLMARIMNSCVHTMCRNSNDFGTSWSSRLRVGGAYHGRKLKRRWLHVRLTSHWEAASRDCGVTGRYNRRHGRRYANPIANRVGRSDRRRATLAAGVRRTAQAGRRKVGQEKPGQTLQATALVHEAYLRLVDRRRRLQHWDSRGHFFAAAAESMRRILVDNARRKKSLKRGGNRNRVELGDVDPAIRPPEDDLIALNEALDQLAEIEPQTAELVKLRYFAGLTNKQSAELLGISPRTGRFALGLR